MGDVRLLWLPKSGETTASTDESRYGAPITYDPSIVSRQSIRGSATYVSFDGDGDEANTPDNARLTFGDSVVDQPFTLLWAGNPDTDTSAQTLLSKQNSASVDEWELHKTVTNGYLTFDLIDASASGIIGRSFDTDIGTSDTIVAATYDGSRAAVGINLYKDGDLVDNGTGGTTGTYTAIEDTASLVRLGTRYTTNERFYNGKMGLAVIVAKELTHEEVWAVKTLWNAFADLAL